jgi:hypothetical protein
VITTSLETTQIDTLIGIANRWVTAMLGGNSDLSDDQLLDIETYYAAHLIASGPDLAVQSEKTGNSSATYQGKTEMGLKSTFWGQRVLELDTTGILAAEAGKKTIKLKAITSFES